MAGAVGGAAAPHDAFQLEDLEDEDDVSPGRHATLASVPRSYAHMAALPVDDVGGAFARNGGSSPTAESAAEADGGEARQACSARPLYPREHLCCRSCAQLTPYADTLLYRTRSDRAVAVRCCTRPLESFMEPPCFRGLVRSGLYGLISGSSGQIAAA